MGNDNGISNTCPAHEHGSAYFPCTCGKAESTSSAGSYTFDNYQQDTGITAFYPGAGTETVAAINYTILGLIGEAGEIANKWKKLFRDRGHLISSSETTASDLATIPGLIEDLLSEIGDVQWYVGRAVEELGASLGEVAAANIRKLNSRQQRGKLGGSGDNR